MGSSSFHALILAGGAGTRFWPASRMDRPKQLLALAGEQPMIVETATRVLPIMGDGADAWSRVHVATGAHLASATKALLPAAQLLIEPVPRNTAPCIAWAAWSIARTDPEAVILVLPSDHHIADVEAFHRVVRAAVQAAEAGSIVTIGIRPTRAETGYGYIETSGPIREGHAQRAVRFVEKPNAERAASYLAGGRHLWNAGMFFFRAKDMLDAVRRHLPSVAEVLDQMSAGIADGEDERATADRLFPTMPSISIDHGVMDHLESLTVVPGSFGWSDVGSFPAAWELALKDGDDNAVPSNAILIGGERNFVLDLRSNSASPRKVIALVGVDDLIVVETDDALLVTTQHRAQDVKLVVEHLKKRGETGKI